jgi:hypothetical protein
MGTTYKNLIIFWPLSMLLSIGGYCLVSWGDHSTVAIQCSTWNILNLTTELILLAPCFCLKNQRFYSIQNYSNTKLLNYVTDRKYPWKLIPPNAPDFGVLWKYAIKSMKLNLK